MASSVLNERPLLILLILELLLCPLPALGEKPFDCGDGPRYKIEVKEFQITYSGESLKANLGFFSRLQIGVEVEGKTLQKVAEATQQWNQLLVGLAEGYNSCAISKKQFEEALRSLYPGLQSDAQKMVDMGKALKEGRQADLKDLRRLLDQYFQKLERFAKISGKEEIIQKISDKIEEEHAKTRQTVKEEEKKTRQLITPIEPKLDLLLAELKKSGEKDRIIAELTRKIQETERELQKKGASEALAQFKQGNYREAEKLFLKEREEKKGEQASAAFYLGNIKFGQLDFESAANYYNEAAQLDPQNARYLDAAGYSSLFLARYYEAEPLLKRSLAIRGKTLGPDHPDVASSLNNLAVLYDKQGKYADAEPLYKRSLAIWEKALGPDHPDVASSLNNLASLYDKQGKYADAEPLFKRSLAIWEKALGPDHPDVAIVCENLAENFKALGRGDQAEMLKARASKIRSSQ